MDSLLLETAKYALGRISSGTEGRHDLLYAIRDLDFLEEPIFGETLERNTQRFDRMKYPKIDANTERQLGYFWIPSEISLEADRNNFQSGKISPSQKELITKVIRKLIFFDSLQGRAPFLLYGQITSLPEAENNFLSWSFFEGVIHSRSYTEIARKVYPDPDELFEGSHEIPVLVKHEKSVTKRYNEFYDYVILYNLMETFGVKKPPEFMKEFRKKLLLSLFNVNVLEGIRFYPGFASVWAIQETTGTVPGISETLKFICRDENVHLDLVVKYLKILRDSKEEGFSEIYEETIPELDRMYKEAAEEEFEWTEYLFEGGVDIVGYNEDIAKEYVAYVCNRRLAVLGRPPAFPDVKSNPIPWIGKYVMSSGGDKKENVSSAETLPQEKSAVSDYVIGVAGGSVDEAFEEDVYE